MWRTKKEPRIHLIICVILYEFLWFGTCRGTGADFVCCTKTKEVVSTSGVKISLWILCLCRFSSITLHFHPSLSNHSLSLWLGKMTNLSQPEFLSGPVKANSKNSFWMLCWIAWTGGHWSWFLCFNPVTSWGSCTSFRSSRGEKVKGNLNTWPSYRIRLNWPFVMAPLDRHQVQEEKFFGVEKDFIGTGMGFTLKTASHNIRYLEKSFQIL